jgi:hypothetical protein
MVDNKIKTLGKLLNNIAEIKYWTYFKINEEYVIFNCFEFNQVEFMDPNRGLFDDRNDHKISIFFKKNPELLTDELICRIEEELLSLI